MSEHENRQLVERAYANFKAGDIPTLLQSMSEDITWQLPEVENVPFRQATGARRALHAPFKISRWRTRLAVRGRSGSLRPSNLAGI
jgi:ketosteroid isomerase-like protein